MTPSYQTNGSIKFVDRAKTLEYVTVLVESLSCEERALALVASFGVDLHCAVGCVEELLLTL